jgi:hypothetical protein
LSALQHAAIIIAEAGRYADLGIANRDEFDLEDRAGRIRGAADALVGEVAETLADAANYQGLVRVIARLVARAMMAQYQHDKKITRQIAEQLCDEGRCPYRVEPPRLSISPAAAETIKSWLDDLVENGARS